MKLLSRPTAGRLTLVAFSLTLACAGCSDSKGNKVTGKVTFKGQPVASGKIYFTPDASKKNAGMSGYADIKDGSYDTSAKGSQGTDGGPMGVKIEGYDSSGKMIFTYSTTVELPKDASATQDFDVPETAAKNVRATGGAVPEP